MLWVDGKERHPPERTYMMDHAFLGPEFSDAEIEEFLRWTNVPYRRMANVADEVADLLVQDKVIGWFQGRMEMGPAHSCAEHPGLADARRNASPA